MKSAMIQKRMELIRRELKARKVNCFVLTKPSNVRYVTGFTGDDSWAVITDRRVCLLTDSRYSEQAEGECVGCRVIERKGSMVKAVLRLLAGRRSGRLVAIESSTPVGQYEELKKRVKGRVRAVSNIVESVRSIKDGSEISDIESAARIAAKALNGIRRRVKEGITENELAGSLEFEVRRLGATVSFETIVAFGANGSRPHHRPGDDRLRKNDTVLIDFGVRYEGYCCDLTRCFAVGRPSKLFREAYKAVEEAQAAAISKARAGVEICVVDSAAREVIKRYGLPVYGHGTGHGLGLEVHELPVLSAKVKGRLEAGQVLTIEPGVYIPGQLGVRIEDDVLVTETGCRALSGVVGAI